MSKDILNVIDKLDAISNDTDIANAYDARQIMYMSLYGPDGYVTNRDVEKLPSDIFTVTYPHHTFMDKILRRKLALVPSIESKYSDTETLRRLVRRGALGREVSQMLQNRYDALVPAVVKATENKRMVKLSTQAKKIIDGINARSDIMPPNVITHVTQYLPRQKQDMTYIPSTLDATNAHSVRATVHVYIDGIVANYHGQGADWESMPYIIMAPLGDMIDKNGRPMIFNREDTFWAVDSNGLRLPDSYRLVRPAQGGEITDGLYKIMERYTVYKNADFVASDIQALLRDTNDYMRGRWTYFSDIKNVSDFELGWAREHGMTPDEYIQKQRNALLREMSRNNAARQTSRFWYNRDFVRNDDVYYQELARRYDLRYGDKTAHSVMLGSGAEAMYGNFVYEIEKLTYLIQHPKTKLVASRGTAGDIQYSFNANIKSEFVPKSQETLSHTLNMDIAQRLWNFDSARDMSRDFMALTDNASRESMGWYGIDSVHADNVARARQQCFRPLMMRLGRFKTIRPKRQSLDAFIASRVASMENVAHLNNLYEY